MLWRADESGTSSFVFCFKCAFFITSLPSTSALTFFVFGHSQKNFVAARRQKTKSATQHNQLIVGPRRWAYQVLRQTLGERFMVIFTARIFIKHFFSLGSFRLRAVSASLDCHEISSARNHIFLHVLRNRIVFVTHFCDRDHALTQWTTMHLQTSCKKILVNYNAIPLLLRYAQSSG